MNAKSVSVGRVWLRISARLGQSGGGFALAFLVVWPLVLYWPVTLGQKVFFSDDLFRQFYPFHVELARALSQGKLPLWTPGLDAGFPLLADGFAALYPINLVLFRLLPAGNALSYSILFDLCCACAGMFLLVRSLGLRVASAFLSSIAFGFCGYAIAQIGHVGIWAVTAWLPWLMLFQSKYWQEVCSGKWGTGWFILSSVSVGVQFLAGHLQMSLLNVAAFGVFGIAGPFVWAGAPWNDGRSRNAHLIHSILATVASITMGFGIAAAQLLPTLELAGWSARGQGTSEAFFLSYSLDPISLTQFISPFWHLGPPSTGNLESWAYVGVIPLVFALVAPVLRRDLRTWFVVLFGAAALLLALGGSNPVYRLLYEVPWFSHLRVPARFLSLFVFATALLAATGFEQLQNRLNASADRRRAQALAVICALCTIGLVSLRDREPPEFWAGVWVALPALLVIVAIGLVVVALRRTLTRSVFIAAALGVTLVDLTAFSIPFSAGSDPSLLALAGLVSPSELTDIPRSVQAMDQTSPLYRVIAKEFLSVSVPAVRAALWPDLPLAQNLQGVQAYSSLALGRNDDYIHGMSAGMVDLMGARYFLIPLEVTANTASPLNDAEPERGLSLALLGGQPQIPPTRVSRVEITSYTDQTTSLPEEFLAGDLILGIKAGGQITLPIRIGEETADWAVDANLQLGGATHQKPPRTLSFPAYLSSLGHGFEGYKYVTRYQIGTDEDPLTVTSVGAQSFLPEAGLTIEHISLMSGSGDPISLSNLLHLNDLALAFRSHTVAMWENKDVMPRALIIHAAQVMSDEATLAWMERPGFQPTQMVLLSQDTAQDPLPDAGTASQADEATIGNYQSERVDIKTKTTAPAYLVLADSWYPGWEATVDGKSVPIERADYIFRAVPVGPGEHRVVFEYHPASFYLGAAISGLGLLVCFILVLAARRRPKQETPAKDTGS